jgi:hypothetical protein
LVGQTEPYLALRATLHALGDRLTVEEVAHLGQGIAGQQETGAGEGKEDPAREATEEEDQ